METQIVLVISRQLLVNACQRQLIAVKFCSCPQESSARILRGGFAVMIELHGDSALNCTSPAAIKCTVTP